MWLSPGINSPLKVNFAKFQLGYLTCYSDTLVVLQVIFLLGAISQMGKCFLLGVWWSCCISQLKEMQTLVKRDLGEIVKWPCSEDVKSLHVVIWKMGWINVRMCMNVENYCKD